MNPTDLVAVIAAGFALVSVGYWLLTMAWLKAWLRSGSSNDACLVTEVAELPPITFFRPLKHGVPGIREKLCAFIESVRAHDQIIFGVEPDTEEARVTEALQREFPAKRLVVARCQRTSTPNPKISKLQQMLVFAHHEHWVIIDSEFITQPGWLDRFRMEWAASNCNALTAGYRFVCTRTFLQGLDAIPILLTLWPGLSAVLRGGHVHFMLGAVMALRRGDLEAIGGWDRFGADLAEDNRLGAALAAARRTIRLSRQLAPLECDALSWRDYWRHQRRIAVTYRVCNPAGYAGTICIHGVFWAFALVLLKPVSPYAWLIFVATFIGRWWTAHQLSKLLQFSIPRLCISTAIASVVETVCWCAAWFSGTVWWAGRWWLVSNDGKLLTQTIERKRRLLFRGLAKDRE